MKTNSKIVKRILSLVLTLLMVLSLIPTSAMAADTDNPWLDSYVTATMDGITLYIPEVYCDDCGKNVQDAELVIDSVDCAVGSLMVKYHLGRHFCFETSLKSNTIRIDDFDCAAEYNEYPIYANAWDQTTSDPVAYLSREAGHIFEEGESGTCTFCGKMVQTGWVLDSGNWYYYFEDGTMATNVVISNENDSYYFGSDGVMAVNKKVQIDGVWYQAAEDGRLEPFETDTHKYVNGFCEDCGAFEPATLNNNSTPDAEYDDYYEISNAGQLYWFADKVNNDNANFGSANAILTADIVVNEGVMDENSTDAREWTPIGVNETYNYGGIFDGDNHTISGLYFSNGEAYYVGLFGCVRGGTINNTGIINSYFCGNRCVGAIAGLATSSAGMYYSTSKIANSYNASAVNGKSNVGGVVGYFDGGTLTNCYNTGTVTGGTEVGGVSGNCGSMKITGCYNTGAVNGDSRVGGVFGKDSSSTIKNCYNTGAINGESNVGGIIGESMMNTSSACYNTGAVTGSTNVGGVIGYKQMGGGSNCYYLDTTCTGGINGSDVKGTAEAKTAEQFASGEVAYLLQGTQAEEIWGQIINTDAYPVLGGDKVYQVKNCKDETVYSNKNENKDHIFKNGVCTVCDEACEHEWTDGVCTVCGLVCEHEWYYGTCEICGQHCNHPKCEAKFSWENYDGSYYAGVELTCTVCGQYADSYSDYAELQEEVEAVDCLTPGSITYTITYEYNGEIFTDTKTVEVKSDNHVGKFNEGFCSECGGFEPATLNNNSTPDDEYDDYYEISNAGQLYWYAQQLNEKNLEIHAKLTKDITIPENAPNWEPINCGSAYFDGNFKTISGLKCIGGDAEYVGLFGMEGWWYEISNLHITDSYFEGKSYVGAVVACMTNGGKVANCYVTNTTVKGDSYRVGTLVGSLGISNIINCYVDTDNLVGYYDDSYGNVENSYYLADTDDGIGGKTAEQFKSGEVAYLLQAGVPSEEIYDEELGEWVLAEPEHIWGQNIGNDLYPVLGGAKVYEVKNCLNETIYSNDNKVIQHNIVDDTCTLCGGVVSNRVEGVSISDVTLDSFTVTYKKLIDAENYWIFVNGVCYGKTKDTSCTVNNRKEGTKYDVMVVASFADYSMTAKTYADIVEVTTLKTEYNNSCAADVNSIKLEWTSDATKTWIFIGKDPQSLTAYGHSNSNSYEIKNLKPNTNYYVQIKHVVDGKLVVGSDVMMVTTKPDSRLNVAVSYDDSNLTVDWNAIEGSYKYWVIVSTDDRELIYATKDTSFVVSGIDKDCTVQVRAACDLGNGSIKMVDYNIVEVSI